ncbi:MAG TPA: hypothetical protein VHA52_05430, partial [Candidatus Babeliaceae bacterium]|nr:hypothetical protein [Candidatus Babeliaceae bacterium]
NTLKQLYKLNTSERNAIGITLASLFPEPTKNNIKRQFRLLAKYSCSEQAKQLVELVNQPDNKQLTDIVYMVKCLKKVKRVMLTDKLLVKGELIIGNTILLEASLALFNDKPYFQLKLEDSLLGLTGFLGKGETFKFFFDHGLSPNTMHLYKFRRTLLSRALQSNTLESVEVLLKQGADPNITVDSKSAPHLFNYIWMHDRKPESELVSGSSLLLKYGAQKTINFKDTYGKTVLDFVVESKRGQDLITLLVAHGAKHSSSLHNDIR